MNITEECQKCAKDGLTVINTAKKLGLTVYQVRYQARTYMISFNRGWSKHPNKGKIDLTGVKSGKLTVIQEAGRAKSRAVLWLCQCECGKQITITSQRIKEKVSKHCGCGIFGNQSAVWTGHEEITGSYFASIKSGAKKRKLDFQISIEYIWKLFLQQNRRCSYSDTELIFAKGWSNKRSSEQTASLDRIDSSKGYIEGNVQWIHKDIQCMKWNKKEEDFIKWCSLIKETYDKKISSTSR